MQSKNTFSSLVSYLQKHYGIVITITKEIDLRNVRGKFREPNRIDLFIHYNSKKNDWSKLTKILVHEFGGYLSYSEIIPKTTSKKEMAELVSKILPKRFINTETKNILNIY